MLSKIKHKHQVHSFFMGCFVFGLVFNSDNFTFADVALSAFFACCCVKYMDGEFLDKKTKKNL